MHRNAPKDVTLPSEKMIPPPSSLDLTPGISSMELGETSNGFQHIGFLKWGYPCSSSILINIGFK